MYSMPAHLGLIWRHKIDRLGLIREEQNRAAGDNKRRHEMDEVRNNLEKIRILADSREWPGSDIRRVLEMLKEKDLLGGYEKELDTAVYRNIFRIWKLAYERKSAPCYEGNWILWKPGSSSFTEMNRICPGNARMRFWNISE